MNIKIKSLHFTPKQLLLDFVSKKVGKLSQFYERIIAGEVSLSTEKSHKKENKLCDIRLIIPGNDLLASTQCKTFEEAIDRSVDVLIKQIEKKKNRNTAYKSDRLMLISQ